MIHQHKIIRLKRVIVIIAILTTSTFFGQEKMYVSLNGSYYFNGASNDYGAYNYTEISADTSTEEKVGVSLGEGINFGGAFGYQFHKNIGAELGVSYLLGSKTSWKFNYFGGEYVNQDVSSKMLQIKPTVVLSTSFEKITPYAKIGAIIGSGSITENREESNPGNFSTSKYVSNGGLAFGYTASLGTTYKINTKFSLFAELNLNSLTYKPTKGKKTVSTLNGVDNLSSIPVADKEFEFVDTFQYGTSVTSDLNTTRKVLATTYDYSSMGLNFGIQYHF